MRNLLFFEDFARLHMLYGATRKPNCAVEIVSALRSHGYLLRPRRVWAILKAMEQDGYLTSFAMVAGGKRRTYFEATDKGRKAIKLAKARLHELADTLLPQSPGFQ